MLPAGCEVQQAQTIDSDQTYIILLSTIRRLISLSSYSFDARRVWTLFPLHTLRNTNADAYAKRHYYPAATVG